MLLLFAPIVRRQIQALTIPNSDSHLSRDRLSVPRYCSTVLQYIADLNIRHHSRVYQLSDFSVTSSMRGSWRVVLLLVIVLQCHLGLPELSSWNSSLEEDIELSECTSSVSVSLDVPPT